MERLYLDSSVFGGYFDEEFKPWSRRLIEKLIDREFQLVFSEVNADELRAAPANVVQLVARVQAVHPKVTLVTPEAVELANRYVKEKVIGGSSMADCLHIAVATLAKTANGYALLVQDYLYDVILLDVQLNGDLNWIQYYDMELDYPYSVEPTADAGFVLAGAMTPGGQLGADIFLIKTDGSGIVNAVSETLGARGTDLTVYPNPTSGRLQLQGPVPENARYVIMDIAGHVVRSGLMRSTEVDVRDLPASVYAIRIADGNGRFVGLARFVKE